MKKLFIIVLYKTEIEKCLTVNSFIECNLFKNTDSYFCVWDNSPEALSERDRNYVESLGKNVVYESHPENTPLAKVYNLVIAKYPDCDYIAIFDQDTVLLDTNYENLVDSAIENNPRIDLFIPKIYTKSGLLYSPGKFIFPGKARKLHDIKTGRVKAKNLTGITSGLIVSQHFISSENFLFNERLKLYGVDTDFFINYTKKRKYLYILPVKIKHSLSFEDFSIPLEDRRKRDEERLDCLFLIYKNFYERLFCHFLKMYYRLKLSLQNKGGQK